MRGRMSQGDSYVQPFEVGQPIISHIVAQVTTSEADGFQEGDIVTGMLPWKNIIQLLVTKLMLCHLQKYHLNCI